MNSAERQAKITTILDALSALAAECGPSSMAEDQGVADARIADEMLAADYPLDDIYVMAFAERLARLIADRESWVRE